VDADEQEPKISQKVAWGFNCWEVYDLIGCDDINDASYIGGIEERLLEPAV
jgi:hypothetical protein